MDQIVRRIRLHLDLFQNDALFLFDIFGAKHGMQHQVRQYVERLRQMLVQHLGVEADQFLRGERVEVATNGIHRARNVFGTPFGGTFEQHVLDEM